MPKLLYKSIKSIVLLAVIAIILSSCASPNIPSTKRGELSQFSDMEATTEELGNLPLPTPGNLKVEHQGSVALFSWTHPWPNMEDEPTFSHYNVYRSVNGQSPQLIGTTTNDFFLDSLDSSIGATYFVSMVDKKGKEGSFLPDQIEELDF